MPARRPKGVVAVTPNGNVTEDMILGYLVLQRIPNAPVSTAKFRRTWLAHGLEERMAPKTRKEVDLFMASCRSVESRRTHNDRINEIKVDRVLQSDEECVYQVTQLVRDRDQKLIEHPKAMRLTYTARDGAIKDEPLDNRKLYKELRILADEVRGHFDRNQSKVPGSKVRAAFRDTLMSEHATRVQGKGVYFVPKIARRTLDDLQGVLADIYGETGAAELAVIPLTSDVPEKEMVKRHFSENVTEEIDVLLAEVSTRLKSEGPLRSDRQANLVAERKRIGAGIARYQDLLDERLLVLDEKVKLLDSGLEQLILGLPVQR